MGLSQKGVETLQKGIEELGIQAPADAIEKLCRYLELIEEWNEKINLTRIVGDDAATLHFLDALSIVQARSLDKNTIRKVVDIGTGLGVPGIVLKIVYPEMELLLVDSLKKRVGVLEEIIKEIGLDNTTAIHARAEDLGNNPQSREKFTLVTARAVADLKILSELCIPLCAVGGSFAAYKGDISPQELTGAHPMITKLGGSGDVHAKRISVPYLEAERTIVLIDKVNRTPDGFPRSFRLIEKG